MPICRHLGTAPFLVYLSLPLPLNSGPAFVGPADRVGLRGTMVRGTVVGRGYYQLPFATRTLGPATPTGTANAHAIATCTGKIIATIARFS